MTLKKSIIYVGAILVILFTIFIGYSLSNPTKQRANSCYERLDATLGDTSALFCDCMGGYYNIVDEGNIGEKGVCRIGYRDYEAWEFFCKMNPTDTKFNDCENQVSQILSSFAPRYDTHLISGKIYMKGEQVTEAVVVFYTSTTPKNKIIDKELDSNGKYEFDIALLPQGWRVGDIGVLEVSINGKAIKKTMIVKSMPHQVENILISSDIAQVS